MAALKFSKDIDFTTASNKPLKQGNIFMTKSYDKMPIH